MGVVSQLLFDGEEANEVKRTRAGGGGGGAYRGRWLRCRRSLFDCKYFFVEPFVVGSCGSSLIAWGREGGMEGVLWKENCTLRLLLVLVCHNGEGLYIQIDSS